MFFKFYWDFFRAISRFTLTKLAKQLPSKYPVSYCSFSFREAPHEEQNLKYWGIKKSVPNHSLHEFTHWEENRDFTQAFISHIHALVFFHFHEFTQIFWAFHASRLEVISRIQEHFFFSRIHAFTEENSQEKMTNHAILLFEIASFLVFTTYKYNYKSKSNCPATYQNFASNSRSRWKIWKKHYVPSVE